MPPNIELENIKELRDQAGIEDVELEKEIRQLRVGNHVTVTFQTSGKPSRSEMVRVRITSIDGTTYRGKLIRDPITLGMSKLRSGSLVTFERCHIHSIPKEPRTNGNARLR